MLKELKFVKGAISTKDLLPAMTHFVIKNGVVRAYNGRIALSCPIQLDLDCKPKAEPLIKAIQNCEDTIQLALTDKGRLRIESGPFRAFIECHSEEVPEVKPEGILEEVDGAIFLEAFKTISPFIGNDASRQWSNGILLSGTSAFATRNVVLVEFWTGFKFNKPINIPRNAIDEILRINEPFTHIQLCENSITFHYPDGRWIWSSLFSTDWPQLTSILDRQSTPQPINPRIFEGLKVIKPFADKLGRVYFRNGGMYTSPEDGEGANFAIGEDITGVYQIDMLQLLEGVVNRIDWSKYPDPLSFYGHRLRGSIVGMKL